jgi:hypothetical protein
VAINTVRGRIHHSRRFATRTLVGGFIASSPLHD